MKGSAIQGTTVDKPQNRNSLRKKNKNYYGKSNRKLNSLRWFFSFCFFLDALHGIRNFPDQGLNPQPYNRSTVLAPGPPGKSKMTLTWVNMRTFLMVRWLRIYLPIPRTWLWPLVGGAKILHTSEQLSPHVATTEPACPGAHKPQKRLSTAKIRIAKNKF